MGIKHTFHALLIGLLVLTTSVRAETRLDQVEFKDASVSDAARILASLSGSNIAVTKEAGGERITLLLQDSTLRHAVDMMARVTGLWYRYNRENNSYIIMTERQYQDDIVVHREDRIRTFTLRHQNVNTTAVTIQSLFGDRVKLSLQKNNDDFDGLSFETAEDATTVTVPASEDKVELQELSRDEELVVEKASAELEQDLTSGELRELGEEQVVDGQKVSSALGSKTPIFIATNKIHNLLFVRTSDENAMAEIAALVEESDKPTPQVLLEMKIVEINVGDGYTQNFDLSINDQTVVDTLQATGIHSVQNGDTGNYLIDYGTTSSSSNNNDNNNTSTKTISQAETEKAQLRGEAVNLLGFAGESGGYYQFLSKFVNARINLLLENDDAEVVAKPVVIASNNRPARLFIGGQQVIATGFESDAEFSSANNNGSRTSRVVQTLEVERRKVGNTLVLLPSVNADRSVTIDIIQDSSVVKKGGLNFPFYDNNAGTIRTVALDAVDETSVKTVVVAKDGLTVALGGMFRSEESEQESKVPLLGDLPLIGEFFKDRTSRYDKSQYVMLITPHILLSPEEAEDKSREIAEFDFDKHAEESVSDSVAKVYTDRDFIEFVRFAAGNPSSAPEGIRSVPVSAAPMSYLINNPDLSVWPVSGWQKDGLYLTLIKMRNHGDESVTLDLAGLAGDWLAVSADSEYLGGFASGEDGGQMYLLSERPFGDVVADLNAKGGS